MAIYVNYLCKVRYILYTVQVFVVKSVVEKSTAYQAGLRVNDRIMKINGTDTKGMTDARMKRQFTTSQKVSLKIQRMTTTSTDSHDSTVCVLLHCVSKKVHPFCFHNN